MNRDYSSISPSAKALLYLKALTAIPFAKEAVELITRRPVEEITPEQVEDPLFIGRLIHFENRYWSIDDLLNKAANNNVLELSSGYSFRGLSMAAENENIFYVDTDLPELIESKKNMVSHLIQEKDISLKGKFFTDPLNALDEAAFEQTLTRFAEGPISIINEGLLMYLNTEEKKNLCRIIHKTLSRRSGCWITADIYIKKNQPVKSTNDKLAEFFRKHHIEENKFESFEQAESFFYDCGLQVINRAAPVTEKLTSLKYLKTDTLLHDRFGDVNYKIRDTWALAPIN